MCSFFRCISESFQSLFKKDSPTISCCENINCTSVVRTNSDMSANDIPSNIDTLSVSPTVIFAKGHKRTRSTFVKPKPFKTVPTVIEISHQNKSPGAKPQILLDDGWCMYMGDIEGGRTTAEFLHIRHVESLQAIAIPNQLCTCLLQGMVELQK